MIFYVYGIAASPACTGDAKAMRQTHPRMPILHLSSYVGT